MENMLHKYNPAENNLLNISHKLFKVECKLNKQNTTCIVLSPKPKNYKHAYIYHPYENPSQIDSTCLESTENIEFPSPKLNNNKHANNFHTNKNSSQNDNTFVESDEYDSDCSLGSLNSLYLRLKVNSKVLNLNKTDGVSSKQLHPTNCKLGKTDSSTRNNIVIKTNTSENRMANDKTQDLKPITKLNTLLFYGKQKPTYQNRYTWRYTSLSHMSLKNPKQKRHCKTIQKTVSAKEIFHKNNNFNRSQLKKPIPLLQFTAKHVKKIVQNNQKYSWTNTAEKLLPNKIEFIPNYEYIIKKEDNTSLECSNVENQLYEQNTFYMNDFIDTEDFFGSDDFGGTKDVENIIQQLFEENDNTADIETYNGLKNEHDYEVHHEIEDKFCMLFKEFNNIKPYDD